MSRKRPSAARRQEPERAKSSRSRSVAEVAAERSAERERRRLRLYVLAALLLAVFSWWRYGGAMEVPGLSERRQAKLEPVPTLAPGFLDAADEAQVLDAYAEIDALASRLGTRDEALGEAMGELGKMLLVYDHEGAEAALSNAHGLAPDDYRWPHFLGHLAMVEGRPDEALALLAESLRLEPGNNAARLQLAEIHLDSGRPDEAAPLIETALARDPGYYWGHALNGRLAAARGDHEAAVLAFEHALSLEPDARILNRPLALSYRALGEVERGEALLAKASNEPARRFDPLMAELQGIRQSSESTLRQVGEMLAEQPELALSTVATVEAKEPENAEALVLKAKALLRLGRLGEAASAAQGATKLAPTGPQGARAQQTLGEVLVAMGAEDGAANAYRKAIELNPDLEEMLSAEIARLGDEPAIRGVAPEN